MKRRCKIERELMVPPRMSPGKSRNEVREGRPALHDQPVLSAVMKDKLISNNNKLFASPRNLSIEMRIEMKHRGSVEVELPHEEQELLLNPHHTVWHHSPGKYSLVTPLQQKKRKALELSPVKFPDIKLPKRSCTTINSKKRHHHMHLRGLFYDSLIANLKTANKEKQSYFEEQPSINYDWGFGEREEEQPQSILRVRNFMTTMHHEHVQRSQENMRETVRTPLFGKKRTESPPKQERKKKKKKQDKGDKYTKELHEMRNYYSKPKEVEGPKVDLYDSARAENSFEELANLTFSPRKVSNLSEKEEEGARKQVINSTIPEIKPGELINQERKASLMNLHRLRGESLVKLLNKYRNHSENKKAIFKKQQEAMKNQKEVLERERTASMKKN